MSTQKRTAILWRLMIASALMIFPVFLLLPLAYAWREDAKGTSFASHYRSIIPYGWLLALMPFAVFMIPSIAVGIALAGVVMSVALFTSMDGLNSACHGHRHKDLIF